MERINEEEDTSASVPQPTEEDYQQHINSTLVRLNEGSKYQSPAAQDVKTFKKRISVRNLTSMGKKRSPAQEPEDPLLTQRAQKIAEFVEGERAYLQDLLEFQMEWLDVIKKKRYLNAIQIATIFSNFEYIASISEELVFALDGMRSMPPSEQMVGGEFLRLNDYFGMYTQYSANFPKAVAELHQCRKSNKKFEKQVQDLQGKHDGKSIEYYLELPCQRVKNYPNILKAILNITPKSHNDYKVVYRAMFLLDDIVANVENERKILENNAKVLLIEALLDGNHKLSASGRIFLNEVEVQQWQENKEPKGPHALFLFSDALLVTRSKRANRSGGRQNKGAYTFVELLPIEGVLVGGCSGTRDRIHSVDILLPLTNRSVIMIFSTLGSKESFFHSLSQVAVKADAPPEDAPRNPSKHGPKRTRRSSQTNSLRETDSKSKNARTISLCSQEEVETGVPSERTLQLSPSSSNLTNRPIQGSNTLPRPAPPARPPVTRGTFARGRATPRGGTLTRRAIPPTVMNSESAPDIARVRGRALGPSKFPSRPAPTPPQQERAPPRPARPPRHDAPSVNEYLRRNTDPCLADDAVSPRTPKSPRAVILEDQLAPQEKEVLEEARASTEFGTRTKYRWSTLSTHASSLKIPSALIAIRNRPLFAHTNIDVDGVNLSVTSSLDD